MLKKGVGLEVRMQWAKGLKVEKEDFSVCFMAARKKVHSEECLHVSPGSGILTAPFKYPDHLLPINRPTVLTSPITTVFSSGSLQPLSPLFPGFAASRRPLPSSGAPASPAPFILIDTQNPTSSLVQLTQRTQSREGSTREGATSGPPSPQSCPE